MRHPPTKGRTGPSRRLEICTNSKREHRQLFKLLRTCENPLVRLRRSTIPESHGLGAIAPDSTAPTTALSESGHVRRGRSGWPSRRSRQPEAGRSDHQRRGRRRWRCGRAVGWQRRRGGGRPAATRRYNGIGLSAHLACARHVSSS